MKTRTHSELYFHFSWSTKNRKASISIQWENRLYGYIRTKCKELGLIVKALNGIEDHVHLLVRIRPEHSASTIAHDIKGASSHFVNSHSLCKEKFAWQTGYGVFSVSSHEVELIKSYIDKQKEHHGRGTTSEEWENFRETEDLGRDNVGLIDT